MERRSHPLADLVAPEVLAAAAPAELPMGILHRPAPPAANAPTPASEADDSYHLIPLG